MGKIIKLKTNTDNVLDFLDQIKKAVKEDKIKSLIFVGKCEDEEFVTGHTKMSLNQEIELKSQLEITIINDMIKLNYID